jgi:hypothetical protein
MLSQVWRSSEFCTITCANWCRIGEQWTCASTTRDREWVMLQKMRDCSPAMTPGTRRNTSSYVNSRQRWESAGFLIARSCTFGYERTIFTRNGGEGEKIPHGRYTVQSAPAKRMDKL